MKENDTTFSADEFVAQLSVEVLNNAIEFINAHPMPKFKYDTLMMNECTRLRFKELTNIELIHGEEYSNMTFYVSDYLETGKFYMFNFNKRRFNL
jgi:hypothetical protein